jgi:hypothetical protein
VITYDEMKAALKALQEQSVQEQRERAELKRGSVELAKVAREAQAEWRALLAADDEAAQAEVREVERQALEREQAAECERQAKEAARRQKAAAAAAEKDAFERKVRERRAQANV